MLERARQRRPIGSNVGFTLADAAAYAYEREAADLLFSRFGVMFFAEPVRAFGHMRQALGHDARLLFGCWRTPRENPWLMVPLHAAYRHVPLLPERRPEDPGPFAFANEERVRLILASAGFESIAFEPADLSLDLAGGQGLDAAVDAALEIGPANLALEGQPAPLRAAAGESIRTALARYCAGDTVRLPAALWIVSARTGV
jgi:SAM-dependent methyltransferase